MNNKKTAKRLFNGECVISNYVKSAKQIEGTYNYIKELPRNMTVKDWIQMHKISDNLIIGEEESLE